MRKTVLSLIAAGFVGAVLVPAAHALTPSATGMQTNQSTMKQQQAQLRHDRMLLRRDVRLGKTSEARKLRREINADERSISQAKHGGRVMPAAKSMQPQQPMPPQSPNQTNTNTTTPQTPTNNQ
jgi:hypothetical protein